MPPIRTASMSSVTSTTTATTPAATLRHPSASPVAASSSSAAINGGGGGRSDSVKKVATSKGDEGSQPLSPSARYSDMAREGSPNGADGRGNNGEPQKQQKACIHCRKSKVKCVNEGGPPCRRCLDANLECKFRLRADDENWRERTDDTLSKLSDAVDALLQRGLHPAQHHHHHHQTPQPQHHHSSGPSHHHHGHHPYAHPSHSMPPPTHLPGSRTLSGGGGAPSAAPMPAAPSHYPVYPMHPNPLKPSPHSDHGGHMDYVTRSSPHNHPHPPPLPRTMSGPASVVASGGPGGPSDPRADPRCHNAQHHRRTSSMRSQDSGLVAPTMTAMGSLSPAGAGNPNSYTPGGGGGSGGKNSSQSSSNNSYTPQPLPVHHHFKVGYNHTPAAGFLKHVTSDSTPFFLTNPLPMRWTSGISAGESYGAPVAYVGRDDPRLTCVSRSLIPLERVRGLFIYFADKMQPHSFGFPTFPPSEYMTPLIISAISMVSSLHEPSSRQYHAILKADVKAAIPDDDLYEGRDLDPELGIGVEEITAVCIASSWLGGEEAYRLARLARWWTLAYLKQFDDHLQRNDQGGPGRSLTLGEALTILPPFRQIDLACKLRIWLEAYIVDAHQSFMHEKTPMAPHTSPSYYCEALRTTVLSSASQGNGNGSHAFHGSASPVRLSLHDRQLTGHASLLEILLDAQRIERYHAQLQQHQQQRGPQWSGEAMRTQEELLTRRLADLLAQVDAVDRWRERIRKDEDLSAANPASMDLTFTYLLTRSYIASLAISLDLTFMASAAPAMMPFQTAGLFSDSSTQAGPCASSAEQDWPHSMMCQQATLINTAKESALSALDLACERKGRGMGDRLVAMPTFYHFILSHAIGFLLQLVQRKNKFLLSREARTILSKVESFVQQYVFEITSHGYLSAEVLSAHGGGYDGGGGGGGGGNDEYNHQTQHHASQQHGHGGDAGQAAGTNGSAAGNASSPHGGASSSPSGISPHGGSNSSHNNTAGGAANADAANPTSAYFQTPHAHHNHNHSSAQNAPAPSSSLIPKNIIPGADHPAKVIAQHLSKALAHVKAQSKG